MNIDKSNRASNIDNSSLDPEQKGVLEALNAIGQHALYCLDRMEIENQQQATTARPLQNDGNDGRSL